MPSLPLSRGTPSKTLKNPQKPSNSQMLLHPIPYPTAIAAPIFPGIPCHATQKHKKAMPRKSTKKDAPRGTPCLTLIYLARYPCPVPNQPRKRYIASNDRIIPHRRSSCKTLLIGSPRVPVLLLSAPCARTPQCLAGARLAFHGIRCRW